MIIGAGVGGIATSVFLAQNGYKVSVFEKNGYPGGRCGQVLREGHRFDIGASILLMPELYREVFRISKMKYSCSAFVFHWGMKKSYPDLGNRRCLVLSSVTWSISSGIFKKTRPIT